MSFLSIITPVYNSPETLKAFLDAVFQSTYKNFELILIDDASCEDYRPLLKGYPVVFKRLEQRRGSYFARNVGVQDARGDILLFLDADILIQPDTLQKVMSVFQQRVDISVLIGSYDDDPGARNLVSQFKFLYHHYIHQHEHEYVGSFWSGCGAIKKNVFCALGGFNVELFHDLNAINDIDLGYRLKKNGFRVYNARNIYVKHLKKLNLMQWVETDIFHRGLPWMKILLRYKDFTPTLNVNYGSIVSLICVWLIVFLIIFSPWVDGLSWFAGILGGVFLGCNYDLLRFLGRKRGIGFLLISIPLLFVYYFNCGLCVLMYPWCYKRI
ncbi:MAG: glycosyltransferase family 2 protein [Candidatus Omnitrophica bacterium]|nr:glycosyltransferase family 2 protein [Candidatus Omnitrophota bacterium]